MRTPIVVDTSAIVSLISETDHNHVKALKIAEQLTQTFGSIIIPTEIFAETLNIIGKKISHKTAIRVGEEILSSKTFSVANSTSSIRTNALNKFVKQRESVSFSNCIIMAFADYFETKEIFGFDKVFSKNTYKTI